MLCWPWTSGGGAAAKRGVQAVVDWWALCRERLRAVWGRAAYMSERYIGQRVPPALIIILVNLVQITLSLLAVGSRPSHGSQTPLQCPSPSPSQLPSFPLGRRGPVLRTPTVSNACVGHFV
jgi:hypothetical protein